MFRTVLFDLDGTLIDHLPAIHRCYVHTLPQLGLPAPSYEQVKHAIGGGLENAMLKFVTKEQLPEALRIYRKYWDATMLDGATLMPGAVELISALKSIQVTQAVLTNKLGESSRQLCAHLGVASYFRLIIGAKDTPWLKPEKELSEYALSALSATAETTCLIGDSVWDVEAGVKGGFKCYAVTTGTHTAAELLEAGASGVYADLSEVGRKVFGLK